MGDVEEGFGLAVDVAEAVGEGAFDEVDAVVGLLEAQCLVGEGAHHPGRVPVGVGFAGELEEWGIPWARHHGVAASSSRDRCSGAHWR
ncbi:hypothetical protein GCM10010326_00290 [Streptomyces xanthochromogenes]|uniref:Uncharacterized protein n=1 Tax=Streptomyces xanthochromogenes TaxID=67384 RepID=A0ABQ2ZGW5_9ACTN|nr:hypothetical protein GCM10010326_00290 [Streptomyces xanthochromogenes]